MQGRVIEIYGPEASGKTTLALHVIAEAQKQGGLSSLYFTTCIPKKEKREKTINHFLFHWQHLSGPGYIEKGPENRISGRISPECHL